MAPEVIRHIQLNSIMENPNIDKKQKILEVHNVLTKTDDELLDEYKKQNRINLEEIYSSLFKERDEINENKKTK